MDSLFFFRIMDAKKKKGGRASSFLAVAVGKKKEKAKKMES